MHTVVNQKKSNLMELSFFDLKNSGPKFEYTEKDLDFFEKVVFGDVNKYN